MSTLGPALLSAIRRQGAVGASGAWLAERLNTTPAVISVVLSRLRKDGNRQVVTFEERYYWHTAVIPEDLEGVA